MSFNDRDGETCIENLTDLYLHCKLKKIYLGVWSEWIPINPNYETCEDIQKDLGYIPAQIVWIRKSWK